MNHEFHIDADKMALFGLVWFFLMSITYGTNVPSGLFLPGMIVGCAVGDLSARALKEMGMVPDKHPEHF
jgi:H+/Cl- antiporter ClcA